MSQVTPNAASVAHPLRAHRIAVLSALFALLAVTAVVLVLAINDESATERVAQSPQPALRVDSGPEESAVAASIGSQPSAGPSESRVASAIGAPTAPEQPRPDEAGIAAAISGR